MDRPRRRTLKAFTLLELIVVIAIIGVLTAIIIPNTATYMRTSRITAANDQAQQVFMAAQDYLVSIQLRNEQVDTYFGVDSSTETSYIGVVCGAGQKITASDIKFYSPDASGGMPPKMEVAANEIKSRMSGDFQGAWLIEIYPKTYTVKAAFYCGEAPKTGTDKFDWDAVKYVGDPSSPMYYTEQFGEFSTSGTATRSQEGAILYSTNADAQYVGQYPLPIT